MSLPVLIDVLLLPLRLFQLPSRRRSVELLLLVIFPAPERGGHVPLGAPHQSLVGGLEGSWTRKGTLESFVLQ